QQAIAPAAGVDRIGGPVEFSLTPPSLIGVLMDKLAVCDGGRRLSGNAWTTSDGRWTANLVNSHRALPVVVANPGSDGRPVAEINDIAQRCAGLAHVIAFADN